MLCMLFIFSIISKEKNNNKRYQRNCFLNNQLKAPDAIIQTQNQIVKPLNYQHTQYCEKFEITTALVKAKIGVTIHPNVKIVCNTHLKYFSLQELKSLSFGVYYRKIINRKS